MLSKDMTKKEIERTIEEKGDFVKIDYINRLLKEDIHRDLKKFLYLKLSEVYENKKMFNDAAKAMDEFADISITYKDKIMAYIKECKFLIQAGLFEKAEDKMKKAMKIGNASQRAKIFIEIKNFYFDLAEEYEKENKTQKAMKIYEKLTAYVNEGKLSEAEKEEVRKKLMKIYEKMGMIREYKLLEERVF